MKKITLNNKEYEVIENYKDALDLAELQNKWTEYFYDYDYVLGDWSYNKLRLKGFCDKNNKIYNKINDIEISKDYIKKHCAYDCQYFIIKKLK